MRQGLSLLSETLLAGAPAVVGTAGAMGMMHALEASSSGLAGSCCWLRRAQSSQAASATSSVAAPRPAARHTSSKPVLAFTLLLQAGPKVTEAPGELSDGVLLTLAVLLAPLTQALSCRAG
jgi:hypothetical protein